MVIVWLIIGFVVFMVFTGNWARLCEALWPFKYTGVQLSELEDHFNEFARRGYSGAWMVVVAEGTTESVRLRKTIDPYNGGITLRLTTTESPEQVDHEAGQRRLRSILQENDFSFDYGLGGFARNPYGLIIECGSDPHTAALVARSVFLDFFDLGQITTYEVWVKGMIDWRDITVDRMNSGNWWTLMMILGDAYVLGRPYKRCQDPKKYDPFYMLSCVIGIVTRGIRRLFGR
ncbi:MAG: hypothetical protein QGH60_00215 [Phycisphaerae bacterium]|jgi:hypothetical protein|nr:hypothetical protein [Phycisphaerae bacterium]